MSNRILVVGSTNVDLIATARRLPLPGETILGGRFLQANGGKGANQAVAVARSGGNVIFLTAVGDDAYGADCLSGLENEGIDTSFVRVVKDLPTGVALITVDSEGENCIVVAPGANDALTEDIVATSFNELPRVAVCVCQLETPLDGVRRALTEATARETITLLDPAPARDLEDDLLRQVDCMTPNESETEILTGIRPKSQESAIEAGQVLRDRGVGTIIITLGDRGALLVDESGYTAVPAPRVSTVDSTAAGDTFSGCLAARVAEGATFREAMTYAVCGGALAVTRAGAQPSIPCEQAVRALERKVSGMED